MASHFKAIYGKLFYFRYCILIFFFSLFSRLVRFFSLLLFPFVSRKKERKKKVLVILSSYKSQFFVCVCACLCILKQAVISMLCVRIPVWKERCER